jgi:hypothetical protein
MVSAFLLLVAAFGTSGVGPLEIVGTDPKTHRLTHSRYVLLPVETVVQRVNRLLKGWGGFYSVGYPSRVFPQGEPLCAQAHGAIPQQEEPAALPTEVRGLVLWRDGALWAVSPRNCENADLTEKKKQI